MRGPWRPIRLIQIDLDGYPRPLTHDLVQGERIWAEVSKQGQVVGLVEACAANGGLSSSALTELTASFSEHTPAPPASVADHLLPKASVIIPTICENPAELVRTVTSLLDLDYPDFEVIVVDNRRKAGRHPWPDFPGGSLVRVVTERRPGASAARNCGISVATGEVVAFTDDDAVVDPNWLRAIGSRFVHTPEADAIGGLVLPIELGTAPQLWFEEFFGGFSRSYRAELLSVERLAATDALFPYAPGRFGAGCNMAFRRSVLTRLGGFDVSLGTGTLARGGEDLGIFMKLVVSGGTIAFEPAAVVRHTHRRTEREFMHQVTGYGTGLTAMYTAMIVRDPRHLARMGRRVPAGLRLLFRPRGQRSPSQAPSYPRRTLLYQVLGMAYGPLAYARSVVRTRRWD